VDWDQMVTLHYLKYTFNLSDDDVVAARVENPYHRTSVSQMGSYRFFEPQLNWFFNFQKALFLMPSY
jgi:hypothetical protein